MTDARSGPRGKEQGAPAGPRQVFGPEDRDTPAASTRRRGGCGADCGCLGNRPSESDRMPRAASDACAPSDDPPAKGFTEAWSSTMARMGGRGEAFSSCCAPFADRDAGSSADDSAAASTPRAERGQ